MAFIILFSRTFSFMLWHLNDILSHPVLHETNTVNKGKDEALFNWPRYSGSIWTRAPWEKVRNW